MTVDTQSGAATDNLTTINGGYVGDIVTLHTASGTRDVVVTEGTGIRLSNSENFTLSNTSKTISLMRQSSTVWVEVGRGDN